MTSVSAGHIILTPTQPVGSGRPEQGSNPRPPDVKWCALPIEPPRSAAETAKTVTDLSRYEDHHTNNDCLGVSLSLK